jgi:uncharacterized protein YjbI with pentapeptide repeats
MSESKYSYTDYINNPHLIYENDDAPKNKAELLSRIEKGEKSFQGTKIPNSDLSGLNLSNLNFCGSDFSNSNFSDSNLYNSVLHASILTKTSFNETNLCGCDFSETNLSESEIISCQISNADFTDANLSSTTFECIDVERAIFSRTSFLNAVFNNVNFTNSWFDSCLIYNSIFNECSLVDVKIINTPLECFINSEINEMFDITIDWKSIGQSLSEIDLSTFLRRCGIPELVSIYLIDSVKTLDPEMIFKHMQKVFISYGSPDVEFARKLKKSLTKNGVSTWFFEDDADFGQKLHKMMRENIRKYDRVLLICSEKSLTRPGVLNEIEQTLSREAREGGSSIFIPINLDNHIFSDEFGNKDISQEILDRVAADFTNDDNFESQIQRLLKILRVSKPDSISTSDNISI